MMSSNEGSRNGEEVGSRVDDSITDHDGIIDQEVLTCCSTPDGELKVPILEVKCGKLTARLHIDKFICPGIHQPCIELNGELISPKEFTIRANKDKQKDWKGSIRIGKSNMRALMEMKTLDFYNHESYCSAKCQSRNYVTTRNLLADPGFPRDFPYGISSSFNNVDTAGISGLNDTLQAMASQSVSGSAFSNMISDLMALKTPKTEAESLRTGDTSNAIKTMRNQPVKFWSVLNEMNLLPDVLDLMVRSLEQMRSHALSNPAQRDAVAERLTRLACALGIEDAIAGRINQERMCHAAETNMLSSELIGNQHVASFINDRINEAILLAVKNAKEKENCKGPERHPADLRRKTEAVWKKIEDSRKKSARLSELLSDEILSSPPKKSPKIQYANDDAGNLPIVD